MSNLRTIFRRELGAYFNSAIAYIFVVVFVVFANGLFMLGFFQAGKADMRAFFGILPYTLNIFVPAIAMRLWAEERRTSTYELLLTFPMKPHELVLGKYLASLAFYLFSLAATLTVPVMISMVGRVDLGPIAGGYFGALLAGALFLAIGIFISGLCKDQIVAFILTMIASFAVFFSGTDYVAALLDGWTGGLGSFVKAGFGMAGRLVGFGKGVLDTRDVLYFLVMTAVFLFLNGLSLEGRYRPKAKLFFSGAVTLCLASVVLFNWLMRDLPLGRWDITEGKSYTVSQSSIKILKSLKVPARVRYFVSSREAMPTVLRGLEQDLVDKLEELRAAADGKFEYKVVHIDSVPDAKDPMRQTLQNQGVNPFQVESVQKDEIGVKLIYSTIVIEYKEKPMEIIPRVVPSTLQDIEYQLLSRIFKLTLEERPVVALYAPVTAAKLSPELEKVLEAEGKKDQSEYTDDYRTISTLMRNNGYDVRRIALTASDGVPPGAKMLMLLKPGALVERQRYEVDRYLAAGGIVLAAAQGFEYSFSRGTSGMEAVPKPLPLEINTLTGKHGIRINGNCLLDEQFQVISVTTGQRVGPFALEVPLNFPNQINVPESQINRSAAVMDRIPSLAYLWGSALDLDESVFKQYGLKPTVLFWSSARSWQFQNSGSANLSAENTKFPSEGSSGKFPLGVLIEGQFQNSLGADAPAWVEGGKSETVTLSPAKPGKLLVIGCSQIFSENLIQNPGNINLFANIVDGYTLGEDLLKIRSKFRVIRDLKRTSNVEKVWWKFFTVLLVPLLLSVAALVRSFIRRKEKQFYIAALKAD